MGNKADVRLKKAITMGWCGFHRTPSRRYVKKMKNTDKDDYKVIFGGATISKREAKKVLITFVFGMLGIVTIGLIFGLKNKVVVFIVSFILAVKNTSVVYRNCDRDCKHEHA